MELCKPPKNNAAHPSCLFWFLITEVRGQQGKGRLLSEAVPGSLCQLSAVSNHSLGEFQTPAFVRDCFATKKADILFV